MNIAFIADDNKKTLMEDLCIAYRHILSNHNLYATGTTGRLIEECTGLPVYKYLTGHLGGEQQLGVQVAHNNVDLLIYLRDAERSMDSAGQSVLHMCDVHNIPSATNLATAEVMLLALERGDLRWREFVR